mgnify:CR=1 FL=1
MKNSKSLIVIFFIVLFFLTILFSCRDSNIPPAKIDSFSEVRTIQVLVSQSYYDEDIRKACREAIDKILKES